MIKRILVGLGGSPYTSVGIRRAVELAIRHEAEITGVTLLDKEAMLDHPESGAQAHMRLMKLGDAEFSIAESITEFHTACEEAGVKQRRVVQETERPFNKLIDLARYHDLVIFGLQKLFKYTFFSENPHDLLVRLVTAGVRPLIAVTDNYRSVSRVLIAYSGSMESAKAMKRFVQLELFRSVTLKVVTFGNSNANARLLLDGATEFCHAHGYVVESQTLPGSAKDGLLIEAKQWEADMIVLGNSARSVLLRHVLGDTALHVMQHADVPLFVCQ